jgi:hypothetical protein
VKRELRDLVTGVSGPNSPFKVAGPILVDNKMLINPQMEWAGGGYISNTIGPRALGKNLLMKQAGFQKLSAKKCERA